MNRTERRQAERAASDDAKLAAWEAKHPVDRARRLRRQDALLAKEAWRRIGEAARSHQIKRPSPELLKCVRERLGKACLRERRHAGGVDFYGRIGADATVVALQPSAEAKVKHPDVTTGLYVIIDDGYVFTMGEEESAGLIQLIQATKVKAVLGRDLDPDRRKPE